MKFEKNLYKKVSEDANYISKIASELEVIQMLDDNDLLSKDKTINHNYEPRQLRKIKDIISNIYLILDLHEIKSACDDIYNSEFKPSD